MSARPAPVAIAAIGLAPLLAAAGWAVLLLHLAAMDAPMLARAGPGMDWLAAIASGVPRDLLAGAPCLAPAAAPWPAAVAEALAMWTAMTLAMMLPLLGRAAPPVVAGYLAAWAPFCLAGALAQGPLVAGGWLDAGLVSASPALSAGVLALAALTLPACRPALPRTPLPPSVAGGFSYGLATMRDCGPLMATMLVAGLMNLVWMAILTVAMLALARRP